MKKTAVLFIILLSINSLCFAFEVKNIFKKTIPTDKPKMPETKQQWLIEAQSIPLEERSLEKPKLPDDKKYIIAPVDYIFERYNYPPGKREINISNIKKSLFYQSYLVVDNSCRYGAYSYYYYSPDINQISSDFYVEKLDTSKTKQKRILDYNHKQKERIPVIEAGTKERYPNLFRGLTIVDWSADSKKILVKEKTGSTINGIYKTYLYVHFLDKDGNGPKTIKLTSLDEAIKNYFTDFRNIQINKYRYDIEPLGFSYDNDDIILVNSFVYNKENQKIFMGIWSYNLTDDESVLVSSTSQDASVSVNGLILKQTLD